MTEHTPGPWYIEGYLNRQGKREGHIISHGLNPRRDGPTGYICHTKGTTDADARLIEAAPDMLEALQDLLNYAGGWDAPADHPCGRARAAIAKARGAQ
jgi:hypothetical protein